MEQIVVSILVFLAVIAIGGALITARAAKRRAVHARLRKLDHPEREGAHVADDQRGQSRLGGLAALVPLGRPSPRLRQQLAEAGYHRRDAASIFLLVKMILLVAGLTVMAVVLLPTEFRLLVKALFIVLVPATLFCVPNIIVSMRRRTRCNEVRTYLPDVLDLLEISVSSAMGLDMAWNSVGDEIRLVSQTLADEMSLTNLEIHLGATRAVAMRHMAERTDSQEMRSLVAILVQSERFGTSISDALRTFAKSMRESRSLRAEETAEKMAVKLLFHMVVFIFPVVVLVAAGPAGIIRAEALGGG